MRKYSIPPYSSFIYDIYDEVTIAEPIIMGSEKQSYIKDTCITPGENTEIMR